MPDMWMDVDTALTEVPVNIMPLIDDTDFKSRETAIVYNQAGMDLVWNFVTTAGVFTQTAVTPTTAGDYDWTNQGDGMYSIEIPASGGASINNDAEGFGWFTGICTGVLAWRGPTIGFRAAAINNLMIDSASGHIDDAISDVHSRLVVVNTETANIYSDTTHIHSDTLLIENWGLSAVASDTTAIESELDSLLAAGGLLSDVASKVTVIDAWTDAAGVVSNIYSRAVGIDSELDSLLAAGGILSDIQSKLVIVDQNVDDIESELDSILGAGGRISDIHSGVNDIQTWAAATGVVSNTYSRLVVVEAAIDSDTASAATKLDDIVSGVNDAQTGVDALEQAVILFSGTADSGSTTTLVDAALTEADTDYWKGARVLFTSGNIAGQVREITAFTPGTDTVTFSPATTQAVATHNYVILQGISASGMSAAQDSKLTQAHSDILAADVVSMASSVEAIEAGGGSLTAPQDSKLTEIHGDVNNVEAAIDSDQTSRTAAISDVKSLLTVVEAAIDSDQVSRATAISDVKSHLTLVDAAIDSDQTSRTAAISDVKSLVTVVEAAIDSDQVSRITAISDVKSELVIISGAVATLDAAVDSDQTSRTAAISDVKSLVVVVEAAIDSDQTSRATAISDVKSHLTLVHSETTAIQDDLPIKITKNTAHTNFSFKMVDATDGYTAETGVSVTAQRSIDGAAFASCANAASEIAQGWYKIDLDASDLNGDEIILRFTGTGCRATEFKIRTQAT